MPKKKKEPIKLPPAEAIASAKPLITAIAKYKDLVSKTKQAATTDGKFNKYDLKYRISLKHLKRSQRKLRTELTRVHKDYNLKQERAAKAAEAASNAEKPAAPAAE